MWALTLRRLFIHSFHLSTSMVAILSAPKPLPISTIPLCAPSHDFHPIVKTIVEKDISSEVMARFQHPDGDVTVDSITVSVYNGLTRVGGSEYLPSRGRDYPFIHTEGDITAITMLPKATLLEGEIGYKECSSMDSAPLSLRIYYSILVHTKNFFGNDIKGRIEYSRVYSVCCACQMKQEYLRHYSS